MQLRGFTLIELVIYMAILGMLGAGVFSAYTFFLKHQIRARQIAELRFASDDASRHFHEYLGGADKITIRGSGHHICAIATHHEFFERTGLTLTSAEKLTARSFGGVGGRTSRSLSFWIRASGRTSPQTIIDSGTDQPGRRWQVMTDAEGRIMLDISGSSIRGGSRIRDGNWHHVMLVFNAERTSRLTPVSLTIYINGEPEGLTQAPGTPIIVDTDASVPMSLGGSRTNTSFTGSLAAVKLWKRHLTLPPSAPSCTQPQQLIVMDWCLNLLSEQELMTHRKQPIS
jgi:prepilin-type N-terminal cleavage/methylation domain-containing protein